MKIRRGFVSNSSSSSFIVRGSCPSAIKSVLLTRSQAEAVHKYCLRDFQEFKSSTPGDYPNWGDQSWGEWLLDFDPQKEPLYLTMFISDSTDLEDELLKFQRYVYCSGGHMGPYDEEFFTKLSSCDSYCVVWIQKPHNEGKKVKGQQEFDYPGWGNNEEEKE